MEVIIMDKFVPVLRFMVVSDIHIKDEPSAERERFANAIKYAYRIAKTSDSYKRLDALAVVGDFANNGSLEQFKVTKSIIDENLDKDETKLIISPASHEYHTEGGVEVIKQRMRDVFGYELDNHYVINGFHFVSISPSHSCNFNEEKQQWLAENLKSAAEDGREKPIFVFQHPHNTCTVYGSVLWGEDELITTYMNYPQVIHFSGHSHAPINDPRSIHQQHFTCLGTGTLSYFELDEFDKYTGAIPNDKEKAAQMLIVEADADNRVRIYPYDVLTDNYFPYTWKIDTPSDPTSFLYTNERYKKAGNPYFEDGAEIELLSNDAENVEIKFPQAKSEDDFYVNSYDITVKNSDGFTVRKKSMWSEYYFYDMPEHLTATLDGLDADTDYTVEIKANSFWFTSTKEPLKLKIHTE